MFFFMLCVGIMCYVMVRLCEVFIDEVEWNWFLCGLVVVVIIDRFENEEEFDVGLLKIGCYVIKFYVFLIVL